MASALQVSNPHCMELVGHGLLRPKLSTIDGYIMILHSLINSKSMHIRACTGLTHNKNLVYTVDGEEVSDQVIVSAFQSLRVGHSLLRTTTTSGK